MLGDERIVERPERITLLIVDDHPIVRTGLAALLERQEDMAVVAEAGDGEEAVDLYRRLRPDLVLMDLRLPRVSGVEATARICAEFREARVLVLTTYDGDEDIFRALEAGARGYLLKDLAREELLEAIRAVHRGQRRVSPRAAGHLAERVPRSELTPRELAVLRLIVEGKSNKEIGMALGIAEGTVKVHVTNVLGKLGVSDRTQAATSALERGIVWR
jgi:two-component system NarL family response regulator